MQALLRDLRYAVRSPDAVPPWSASLSPRWHLGSANTAIFQSGQRQLLKSLQYRVRRTRGCHVDGRARGLLTPPVNGADADLCLST